MCTGQYLNWPISIVRWLSMPILTCFLVAGVTGCIDGTGSGATTVTSKPDLDSAPRQLVVSLSNADLVDIFVSGQTAVSIGVGGSIRLSEDGGISWAAVSSGTDSNLRALNGEGQRLVAVGADGTIVRSEDGGKTWATVSSGTSSSLIALHGEGQRLVAVGDNGTIVRSEDGGEAWATVSSGAHSTLAALHGEGQRLVAVSSDGPFVRSEDGGKTWATASSGTDSTLVALHGEGLRLVAVGNNGIIVRSEDGGKTWATVASSTDRVLIALHGEGQRLVAVGDNGTIVRSEDGGKTWATVSSGTVSDLRALHGEGQRLGAVGDNGAIVRSEDGGKTWATVSNGTDSTLIALHGEGQRLVAMGENGTIVRSEDSGKTWANVSSGTDSRLIALHGEGNRLVAVGDDGTIVRSEDGGKTWATVSSGTYGTLIAVHGEGQRLVAAGGDGAIVRSVDGGKTWATASHRAYSTLFLALHGEGQRLVAAGSGGAILRSQDGGKSWAIVSSRTDSGLRALHGDDGLRLVAVGENGIIVRSEDGGKTWATMSSGTDSTLVALHGEGLRLVAVGNNGIIVRSEDGGKTWATVASSTDRVLIALHGEGQRLVAVGTSGTIVLAMPTGPRLPLLERIQYAATKVPGWLELRFEIYDPDAQCVAGCGLKVLGANKTDGDHRRPFNAIAQQPEHDDNTNAWIAQLHPEEELRVRPGENLYLDVTLNGPFLSMRYPLGEKPLLVGYLINSTYYYIGAAALAVVAGLLLVFWLKPLWMLVIYRRAGLFELAGKISVPGLADAVQILGNLLLVPWLTRHPRVLDAWIAQHRESWEAQFRCEDAVERLRYYPLPLRRSASDERIKSPAPDHFRNDFAARRSLLQIVGPGGSGKSSLAAQLGNWSIDGQLTDHPMLPVWLDEDISDFRAWLLERVRAVSVDDDLPETFIKALYRRKRLLVVADRLSEKQVATQIAICKPPSYLNALVVTSRTVQRFGLPDVKVIEAVPLGSENLMGFVNELLESQIEVDDAFCGFKDQVDLARRLADIITIGQQELPVTPLLVKLFVERAKRSGNANLNRLPESVPEVYFDYLRSVNPDDPSAANYLANDVMMEAAKLVARVELGDDFRPKRIVKTRVQEVLQQAGAGRRV
ncbi:MAG: photosystem II stability/assembly factor-like uncharacterized protein [Gammaproteobacteria bacterium]|jgi:photosystem II stability/assembly factor-like uncharacterized protein